MDKYSTSFEFDAFISYPSRTSYHKARKIKRFLETFHQVPTPADVEIMQLKVCIDGVDFKRTAQARTDVSEKNETNNVWTTIEKHLEKSKYLIVFCGPESVTHEYVNREVRWFIENRPTDHIFLVVDSGDYPNQPIETIFPKELVKKNLHHASIWYDLRERRTASKNTPARRDPKEEMVRLASHLCNAAAGDLMPFWHREQLRQTRVKQRIVSGIVVMLAMLTATIAWQWGKSRISLAESQSNLAIAEARRFLATDPSLSFALAKKSLEIAPQKQTLVLLDEITRLNPYLQRVDLFNQSPTEPLPDQLIIPENPIRLSGRLVLSSTSQIYGWISGKGINGDSLDDANRAYELLGSENLETIAFDQSASIFAGVKSDKALAVYRKETGENHSLVFEHKGPFNDVEVSTGGYWVAAWSEKGKVVFFTIDDGQQIDFDINEVIGVGFSNSNTLAAVVQANGSVLILDLLNRRIHGTFSSDLPSLQRTLKNDADQIAKNLSNEKQQLKWLDANGIPVDALNVTGWMTHVIFSITDTLPGEQSPSNQLGNAVQPSVSKPNIAKMFELNEPSTEADNRSKPSEFGNASLCDFSIQFSSDNRLVYIICQGESLLNMAIYEIRSGRRVSHKQGRFSRLAISPDGYHFAIAGPTAVSTYRIFSRTAEGPMKERTTDRWLASTPNNRIGIPSDLQYSPGGEHLISVHRPLLTLQGAEESTVTLWLAKAIDARNLDEHQGVRLLPQPYPVLDVAFSDAGDKVGVLDETGAVRLWSITPDRTLEQNLQSFIFCSIKYPSKELLKALRQEYNGIDEFESSLVSLSLRTLTQPEARKFGLPEEPDPIYHLLALDKIGWPVKYPEKTESTCDRFSKITEAQTSGSRQVILRPGFYEKRYGNGLGAICFDESLSHFLPAFCLPQFSQLINAVSQDLISEEEICVRYGDLLKNKPLLLSGLQVESAVKLIKEDPLNRELYIGTIALSGDASRLPFLQGLKTENFTENQRILLKRMIAFLNAQGRSLTLKSLARIQSPKRLGFNNFMMQPKCIDATVSSDQVQGTNLSKAALQFMNSHGGRFSFSEPLASAAFSFEAREISFAKFLKNIGEMMHQNDDSEAALRYLVAANELDKMDPDIPLVAGNITWDVYKFDMAEPYYLESIERGQSNGWAHVSLARGYADAGRIEDAKSNYEKAIGENVKPRFKSEWAEYHSEFAQFLLDHSLSFPEQTERAKILALKSLDISPSIDAAVALAKAEATLGNCVDALRIQKSVVNYAERNNESSDTLTSHREKLVEYQSCISE